MIIVLYPALERKKDALHLGRTRSLLAFGHISAARGRGAAGREQEKEAIQRQTRGKLRDKQKGKLSPNRLFDRLGDGAVHPRHRGQLFYGGLADGIKRAKVAHQCFFAARANPYHIIKGRAQ